MNQFSVCVSRILLVFFMVILSGGIVVADEALQDREQVLIALEAMADKVAAAPGDCDANKAAATLFNEKYSDTLEQYDLSSEGEVDEKTSARLEAVFEKLSASTLICGSCPVKSSVVNKDDPCKDTKKKCERNCPLGGWSCAGHWAGCMSGYRPSCCWAAACGSKKNCMRVCESSCLCSL